MDLLIFVIGVIVGWISYYLLNDHKDAAGTFVMDFTDPMKDVCRIELDDDMNTLYSKKYIVLKVKVYEDNSHN